MRFENTMGISESLSEIGIRIKDYRIAARMTQEDLAERADVSVSSVCRLEKGQSIQMENLIRIFKVLNLLSKMEVMLPEQKITPMERLNGVTKKKTYRKPKTETSWQWGE